MFCATCGAVQPPGQGDHFSRLGLARDFDVERGDLDRRYFALQRDLHPDRFATRSAREREISMQQSTSLNQAYETVKSPLARAEYLLSLNGVTVNAETGNRPADPDVLMEAMESREALAEAGTEAEIAALAARARESHARCLGALTAAFRADDMDAAARLATRLKYLAKFADEARGRAGALRAP
jgi:molecular chaperone HscB